VHPCPSVVSTDPAETESFQDSNLNPFFCNNSGTYCVTWADGMIRELEFKVLCGRHRDEIYRYALGMLANQPDAEDAAQEVLLRLWNHLPTINPFNLRAWLFRTTRHYCLDQIRRRSHRAAPVLVDDEAMAEWPDELAVNPSSAADSTFRLEQARKALLKLPEQLRSVFVLYEVNGLRYREIANTLGIPINTVKVYLSRAREKLSKLNPEEAPWTRTCND
jgi:RNA polymerase sigma-70 factor, ECF subfamily